MYCRRCKYPLGALFESRCPECGRDFDPNDPRTFISDPPPWAGQQFKARSTEFWLVMLALLALALPVLALVIGALIRM
jgi:hypothetical protein